MDNYFEFFESEDNLEKLEDGLFREHLRFEKSAPETEEITDLFGTPEKDVSVWSKGASHLSDSIMCEKYAAEALSGERIPEEKILSELERRGVYDRDFGCVRSDVGSFSESIGMDVFCETGFSVKDICESLDNNEKIICAVSSVSLAFPELKDMAGLSADSYLEVVGIDAKVSGQEKVIVNNPNAESCGGIFALSDFCSAWKKSGCFAVVISKAEG